MVFVVMVVVVVGTVALNGLLAWYVFRDWRSTWQVPPPPPR